MKELENRLIAHVYNNINRLCSRQHIWKEILNADSLNDEVIFWKNERYNEEDVKIQVTITQMLSTATYYAFEIVCEVTGEYGIFQKNVPYSQQTRKVFPKSLKLRMFGKTLPGKTISSQQIPYELGLISHSDQLVATV